MIRLEDLPLITMLEEVAYTEIDRQFQTGELEPGIAYETAYVDPVSGEVQGIPDMSKVIWSIVETLRNEGMMV